MSEELKQRIEAAQKSLLLASPNFQRKCWQSLRDQAFKENNDKWFDLAEERLSQLVPR